MNLNEFVEEFEKTLDDITTGSIKENTDYKNEIPGWDSLAVLSIISMVDEKFGITISNTDLEKHNSLEELYHSILLKKN